eukprot:COSAG02_NODE_246_length_27291_cov_105.654200_5_plen_147_part_00
MTKVSGVRMTMITMINGQSLETLSFMSANSICVYDDNCPTPVRTAYIAALHFLILFCAVSHVLFCSIFCGLGHSCPWHTEVELPYSAPVCTAAGLVCLPLPLCMCPPASPVLLCRCRHCQILQYTRMSGKGLSSFRQICAPCHLRP